MSVCIRPAAIEDAAAACEAVRRSIAELCHADHQGDPERIARWLSNKTVESFRRWIAAPEYLAFVGTVEGRVLGFALLERAGKLSLLYVSPEGRFRGLCKGMLAAAEEAARGLGIETLRLESSFTAHRFYLACGYEPDGEPAARHVPLKKRLIPPQ